MDWCHNNFTSRNLVRNIWIKRLARTLEGDILKESLKVETYLNSPWSGDYGEVIGFSFDSPRGFQIYIHGLRHLCSLVELL
jgi:hypothetical protein